MMVQKATKKAIKNTVLGASLLGMAGSPARNQDAPNESLTHW